MSGTLFVIATPLGHLDDISPRALDTLRSVRRIACEDTRRTARLLARWSIRTPTLSCHQFNEAARLEPILAQLRAGDDVGLVSDGGTPGISDPGRLLVEAALDAGLRVAPVPGPSAVAALMSVSGMPADRFVFEGFLPSRAGTRRRRLREWIDERRTIVAYESPHRILATLRDVEEVLGPRRLVLGRELTKMHETLLRGTPGELIRLLGDVPRGEICFAVPGAAEDAPPASDASAERLRDRWRNTLETHGGDRRAALRVLARELGLRRAELYRRLAELDEQA